MPAANVARLQKKSLTDLRALYTSLGLPPNRSPNKVFLARKIDEAQAAAKPATPARVRVPKAAIVAAAVATSATTATEPAPEPAQPARKRGRFAGLTVEQLQAEYLAKVGRPSDSTNVAYLQWKIREAEKGRITVGPARARKVAEDMVLPLRLPTAAVEILDAAQQAAGYKSRTAFLRDAIVTTLRRLDPDAATRFEAAV